MICSLFENDNLKDIKQIYSYYRSNTHRSHVRVDRLYEGYKGSLSQWSVILIFAYAKTKMQINCAVIAQLISAFIFDT